MPANSECTTPSKQSTVFTTFVETDRHKFKELVQKLTGVSEAEKLCVTMPVRNSKKGSPEAEGNCSALMKGGIEVGSQKSGYKLHQRRQFKKKVVGPDPGRLVLSVSPTLIPSPITPLAPADPFTCFNDCSPSCCSTLSCNQFPCLAKEEEGFCFQPSPISMKREPELLPLFPLQSPTQPRST